MIDPKEVTSAVEFAGLRGAAVYLTALGGEAAPLVLDPGEPIYPASMIKTPLAVATAHAVETGRLAWEARVAVNAANMTVNDAPSPLVPGSTASVSELCALMLSHSDNVATNMLFDLVGREQATADLAQLGFPETAFRRKLSGSLPLIDDPQASGRNTHPARDAAELFCRIADNAVPGAARILAALRAQYWNTKLSAGLEPGDRFAHKTGDTDETSHDGGILELAGGGRAVIVVYTPLESSDATDARFATFMRTLRPRLRMP